MLMYGPEIIPSSFGKVQKKKRKDPVAYPP
jgi:hypothetical protein